MFRKNKDVKYVVKKKKKEYVITIYFLRKGTSNTVYYANEEEFASARDEISENIGRDYVLNLMKNGELVESMNLKYAFSASFEVRENETEEYVSADS